MKGRRCFAHTGRGTCYHHICLYHLRMPYNIENAGGLGEGRMKESVVLSGYPLLFAIGLERFMSF